MGEKSRNSVRNGVVSASLSVFLMFLSFVSRTLFIHRLSAEYLGLSGLFSNILSILALSELGIGNAMSYAMYQPITHNDEGKIRALLRLYKKQYLYVGLFILASGIAVTPFLSFLIKDMPANISGIPLYFLLFVASMALPYFFTYKRTLIICYQKEYIISIITGVVRLLTVICQLIILIVLGSYLWYLVISLLSTFAENVFISHVANRMFPFIRVNSQDEISAEEKETIRSNIKAIFLHKIGGKLTFSTDNLIISKVIGLAQLGVYSNYSMITENVNSIFSKIIISCTPSLGNLMVESSKEHSEKIFYHLLFVNAWIYGFVCACFMCLIQPFISIWIGNAYLLSDNIVLFIVAYTYLTNMRLTVLVFKDSAGIYVQDRFKPLIEGCVNIAVSIPLAVRFGIPGVLMGTLISIGCISFWWEALVFFKHAFGKGIGDYMLQQLKYLVFNGAIVVLCYYLSNLIYVEDAWFLLFLKAVVCLIVPNVIYLVCFKRTDDFAYVLNILSNRRLSE